MSGEPCESAIESRLVALDEKLSALDRLMNARLELAQLAVEKSEVKIDERFASHNQFREQLREERGHYVTRQELQWLIGVVIVLVFAVVGLFLKVPR